MKVLHLISEPRDCPPGGGADAEQLPPWVSDMATLSGTVIHIVLGAEDEVGSLALEDILEGSIPFATRSSSRGASSPFS